MPRDRLKASLAVCAMCGCASAGGLLASGAASDKAVVGGALVAVAGAAFTALAHFAQAAGHRAEPGDAAGGGGTTAFRDV